MEPDEAQVTTQPLSGTKRTISTFLSTLSDDHLILHLTHVAEVWFKDADILALEEFIRRYKDNAQLRRTFP